MASVALSDEQLASLILNLLFAGYDTSASAMTNTLYMLAQHPKVRSMNDCIAASLHAAPEATCSTSTAKFAAAATQLHNPGARLAGLGFCSVHTLSFVAFCVASGVAASARGAGPAGAAVWRRHHASSLPQDEASVASHSVKRGPDGAGTYAVPDTSQVPLLHNAAGTLKQW